MRYDYLIVGGGMAADAAARAIRQADEKGSIGLIGKEPDPPYNRPPLSKGLWKRLPLKRIWRNTAKLGVDLILGREAVRLDPAHKTVWDDQGAEYQYNSLLLATGAEPVRPWPAGERILYYRTLQDYLHLRALMETGSRFLVVGGGFIGSEIAAALIQQGKQVTMIFPEAGIGGLVFPETQARYLTQVYREKGARMLAGNLVQFLFENEAGVVAVTSTGERIEVDAVVAGLGVRPNTGLAERAGLELSRGILVDESLRTSAPDIFAAGDAMVFYNPALGHRLRLEHEENANASGAAAGLGMAKQPQRYTLLPSFYSDLFDLSYQAIGEIKPEMELVEDWIEPHRRGAQYFLRDGRVRGAALWSLPYNALDQARELIAAPGPFKPNDLIGRIRA